METISKREYNRILSELDLLTTKFVALEQENEKLLRDLQQASIEKAQQQEELSKRVQQLELVVLSL
jgi:outer membrane murein-binding lipoprotein Lpp